MKRVWLRETMLLLTLEDGCCPGLSPHLQHVHMGFISGRERVRASTNATVWSVHATSHSRSSYPSVKLAAAWRADVNTVNTWQLSYVTSNPPYEVHSVT